MPGVIVDGGSFFESPRWHGGRWWVSDFYRRLVLSFEEGGRDVREEAVLDDQPSGLGWKDVDELLVVSMERRALLRREPSGATVEVAGFGDLCSGSANDLVVDAMGRAWVSTLGFDVMAGEPWAPSAIIRVDPDGRAAVAGGGLDFPNGMALVEDGHTLLVCETTGARISALTVDPSGRLVDKRVWAPLWPGAGPDGCCLDAEGHLWVADAFGRRCVRVEEGGRIVDERPSPWGMRTYACMLGGPDGRTLVQCCAPNFEADRRRGATDAVVAVDTVDVPRSRLGRP